MTTMTDSRAADLLAAHNEWRRYDGFSGEPGAPAAQHPTEIGLAIDHAIARLREPAEAQAQGGGEVFAWFRKQPRAWEVVKDSDLSERPAPGKMLAEGWTPVYTAHPSAPETEESVAADSYHYLTELLEPYVAREGSNPNGPFPASVVESFQMLLEHWKATRTTPPSAPVGVEGLHARADEIERAIVTDGMGAMAVFTQMRQLLPSRAAQQPAAVDGVDK